MAIYRTLWVILFATSVVSIVYFSPRSTAERIRLMEAGHAIGFTVFTEQSAVGAMGSEFSEEGRAIGFRSGDLILNIDGRSVPPRGTEQRRLLSGRPGTVATIVGQHDDGRPFTLRIIRDPSRGIRAYAGSGLTLAGRTWAVFAIDTLAAVISLIAAILLFLRRPRDPVAQLLSFALVLGHATLLVDLPGVPDALSAMWVSIASTMLLLAVLLFPHGRFATRWHGVALLTIFVLDALFLDQWLGGWWSYWTSLAIGIQAAAVVIATGRQLQLTPPGIGRQQAKSVLFGVAAYAAFLALGTILLWIEQVPTNEGARAWITMMKRLFWAVGDVAIPAGLLVSLLRYRLYDAETAISRSVAYGALTVVLVGVFAGSQKVIEMGGEAVFGGQLGAVASALAAAVAAAATAPLHHRVTGWAERRFRSALVHLRQGLPLLVGDLRETAGPAVLADAMLARVELGVRATYGAVIAADGTIGTRDVGTDVVEAWRTTQAGQLDPETRLGIDRADPLFPMRVPLHADGVGLIGWLLLGPRPDGSFYGKDERDTLIAIADPVARALSIVVERERRDVECRQREGDLKHVVDLLCRVVYERLGVDMQALTAVAPGPEPLASSGGAAGIALSNGTAPTFWSSHR